jgi:hypothetical protein
MPVKKISLQDHIIENHKSAKPVKNMFNFKKEKWTPAQVDNRTPEQVSGQVSGHLDNRTPEQLPTQQDNRTREHLDNRTTTQVDNRTREHLDSFNIDLKPKNLKLNQFIILHEIYFNRPFKVKGEKRIGKNSNIPYGTVRNILKSLTNKGYISKPFSINDGVNKGTTCQVNELKCIPVFGNSNIINSEHLDNRAHEQVDTWTSEQQDTRTPGQVNTSYKIDREILNNLSIYIQNSDYWKGQGLTLRQCKAWINEINHCDSDFLLQQLQFGEAEPKVLNADKPIDYFYKSIAKNGLSRPKDFEFPEEIAARLKKERLNAQDELLKIEENNRKKEQELADRQSFLTFLEDTKEVEKFIKEIESKFISASMKISIKTYRDTGKTDSRLKGRLKQLFND